MHHRLSKIIVTALSIATLTACGFHLRGSVGGGSATTMSFKTLSIVGDQESTIVQDLASIMYGQVTLVKPPAPAQVFVEIGNISHSKATSAKNSEGRITEYRLYSSVTIQAYDVAKKQLITPVRLTVTRTLSAGDGYATGLDLEEARLNDDMDLDLANQIQYRLRAIRYEGQ